MNSLLSMPATLTTTRVQGSTVSCVIGRNPATHVGFLRRVHCSSASGFMQPAVSCRRPGRVSAVTAIAAIFPGSAAELALDMAKSAVKQHMSSQSAPSSTSAPRTGSHGNSHGPQDTNHSAPPPPRPPASPQQIQKLWGQYFPEGTYFAETADVIFVVDGGCLLAHRTHLAVNSVVFHELFLRRNSKQDGSVVVLRESFAKDRLEDVVVLLRYMYSTDKAAFVQQCSKPQLVVLAKYSHVFHMEDLRRQCDAAISHLIKEGSFPSTAGVADDDALHWLLVADEYDLPSCLEHFEWWLIRDFGLYVDDGRLRKISPTAWERVARGLYEWQRKEAGQ